MKDVELKIRWMFSLEDISFHPDYLCRYCKLAQICSIRSELGHINWEGFVILVEECSEEER